MELSHLRATRRESPEPGLLWFGSGLAAGSSLNGVRSLEVQPGTEGKHLFVLRGENAALGFCQREGGKINK